MTEYLDKVFKEDNERFLARLIELDIVNVDALKLEILNSKNASRTYFLALSLKYLKEKKVEVKNLPEAEINKLIEELINHLSKIGNYEIMRKAFATFDHIDYKKLGSAIIREGEGKEIVAFLNHLTLFDTTKLDSDEQKAKQILKYLYQKGMEELGNIEAFSELTTFFLNNYKNWDIYESYFALGNIKAIRDLKDRLTVMRINMDDKYAKNRYPKLLEDVSEKLAIAELAAGEITDNDKFALLQNLYKADDQETLLKYKASFAKLFREKGQKGLTK